jgi:hypothetical protein
MNDFVLCSHFCLENGLFDSSFALMTFHKYILQVFGSHAVLETWQRIMGLECMGG